MNKGYVILAVTPQEQRQAAALAYSIAMSSVVVCCCAVILGLACEVLEEDPAEHRMLCVDNDIVVDREPSGPVVNI